MLQELAVKNFGLIEELKISFSNGLHVFTGETGAGKSMIIDALSAIIGGRASNEWVRYGYDHAYIEALFTVPKHLDVWFKEHGIEITDGELIVTRDIKMQGKSTTRINGRLIPVSILKEVMEPLVDIHGQHEHQKLLHLSQHLPMLDGYGKQSINAILPFVQESYQKYIEAQKQLQKYLQGEQDATQRIEFLQYQLQDLHQMNLKIGEEQELELKRKALANQEKITNNIHEILTTLIDGYDRQKSAMDLINEAIACVDELLKYDKQYEVYSEMLETARVQIEEVGRSINRFNDIEINESDLDALESRLFQIQQTKRKYRMDVEQLVEYKNTIEQELFQLQNREALMQKVEQEVLQLEKSYYEISKQLSNTRKQVAQEMEHRLKQELIQLSLPNVQFAIHFQQLDKPDRSGIDQIEFMFSANPGEPLRPLAKVASGGELSRIMLGFKSLLADIDQTPTVIFDEVDTGVSGQAAQKIAEKLAQVACNRQILCVTHLPQIAAMSDSHLCIRKHIENEKTQTNVSMLDESQIIEELSRMISGDKITSKTRDHASEMRQLSLDFKKTRECS